MISSGAQIGKYRIGRKLGQGGFGVVFLAQDTSLDREVALKFLNPEHTSTPQILQRFLQEARSAAKVAHPGIVTVYECGQITDKKSAANGAAFIAMELLVGESLTDRLARSGRLDAASAMEVSRQVASALEAAHRAGIVHRDLKPDNIFLVPDPAVVGGERVKVLDFGIAKLGRAAASSVQTQSMMVFGTPRYMSPEQCKSAAHVDHRSDIYTLGCILFELLCGQPPFIGAPGELIARHVLVEPPTVASLVPDVLPALAELVAVMLAKEPDERPQTMAAVQRALESGGALVPGAAPTLPPNAMESMRRMPTPGSLGVRPPVAPLPTEVDANPTTLGSAASSARVESPKRSRLALAVAAAVVVVGVVVAWFALGHNDEPSTRVAEVAPPPAKLTPSTTPGTTPGMTVEPLPPPPPPTNVKPAVPDPGPVKTVPPADPVKRAVKASPPPIAKKAEPPPPGTLAIMTKPTCDVSVDGGPAMHAPPQLKLAAGKHRVTITNSELGISETTTVDIKAGASQSLERDYSDRVPPKKDATINPFAKGSNQ